MGNDNQILLKFKKKELLFIRNLGWISLITAGLYITGYIWRSAYYSCLGIDSSMVDYPFPEMLISKQHILTFAISSLFIVASRIFYKSYGNERRKRRARMMGISYPLDELLNYSDKINSHPANVKNEKNRIFLFRLFYKHMLENNPTIDKSKLDEKMLKNYLIDNKNYTSEHFLEYFKDIPENMAKDFIKYSAMMWTTSELERLEIFKDSTGAVPPPLISEKMRNSILYGGLFLMMLIGLFCKFNWDYRLHLCYSILGMASGFLLSKSYTWEDRYLFWSSSYLVIVLLFYLGSWDGYLTARHDLENLAFPVAEIKQNDGNIQKGLLLATFRESYFILPLPVDPNSAGMRVRIHSHAVSSVKITSFYQFLKELNEVLKKSNEDINIQKEDSNNIQNSNVVSPSVNSVTQD